MKKGDVLICKKDKELIYTKNSKYIIVNILIDDTDTDEQFIQVSFKPGFGEWFYTKKRDFFHTKEKYIWDYFYTTEELRKLKLESFRKMDNFEDDGYSMSANYVLGKDVPYHIIPGMEWIGNVILVYHWCNVYYHTISYNGYSQGRLIHPTTNQDVRWAKLKHCSPIFNTVNKKIC